MHIVLVLIATVYGQHKPLISKWKIFRIKENKDLYCIFFHLIVCKDSLLLMYSEENNIFLCTNNDYTLPTKGFVPKFWYILVIKPLYIYSNDLCDRK